MSEIGDPAGEILAAVRDNTVSTIEARRYLHRHPELTGEETQTLAYIRDRLTEAGIPFTEVEKGGILASLGDAGRGRTVLLRADIDALPIRENPCNLVRERMVISENEGVQHACGHDAHTAMLLAAGKILKTREQDLPGRVLLMFERGEEGGGNLKYLLEYIDAQGIEIHSAHAIHVRPGVPVGKIVAIPGPIMAGGGGFQVTLTGQGGHSSRPDLANSPLDCFTALYQALKDLRLRQVSPFDQLTLAVTIVRFGTKGNIIDNELSFQGSARFVQEEAGRRFFAEFDLLLEGICRAHHCGYTVGSRFFGIPVVNNPAAAAISQEGIRKYAGPGCLIDTWQPLMASESFAQVAKRYPSMMVHLGIDNPELGSGADLHTEFFDLDEAALPLGVAATVGYALEFLAGQGGPG
jgi:amidohydrolase